MLFMNTDLIMEPTDASRLDADDLALLERLRVAAELLEMIDANRGLLDRLPQKERDRLHQAVAQVFNPDPVARRRKQKAAERAKRAAQAQRDDTVLHETGIQTPPRHPPLTPPNQVAPPGPHPCDIHDNELQPS